LYNLQQDTEDRQLLKEVRKSIEARVAALNDDVKSHRMGKRLLQLRKREVDLLERSLELGDVRNSRNTQSPHVSETRQ